MISARDGDIDLPCMRRASDDGERPAAAGHVLPARKAVSRLIRRAAKACKYPRALNADPDLALRKRFDRTVLICHGNFHKAQILPVRLELDPHADSAYFHYAVRDGKLHLRASSGVALCRGFYDYAKRHGGGLFTWSGSSLRLPALPAGGEERRVVSPFRHHYYLNVVTFGYSAPYWDWARWQQEIDWMALHGIDMPLALTAYEAIIARVWKKLGLTDEEINQYFVGPAHLPWMRMGNISGIDGPLNADWHRAQIALQHKILDRMRSLGMKPICPGFAGFVPQAVRRISPQTELVTTHWAGSFSNWMLKPSDPLFRKICTAFIANGKRSSAKTTITL